MDEMPPVESVKADEIAEPRWLKNIKKSSLVAVLVIVAAIFGGIKEVSEGFDKLLIAAHLKPDALDVAQDTVRGQFSDSLIRTAWKRLFWTRRYTAAVDLGLSDTELADIWKGYMGAVEEWNYNLMVNIMGIRRYYGDSKSLAFEDRIVPLINSIHSCLLELRYPAARSGEGNRMCSFPNLGYPLPANTQAIEGATNALNSQLYCFVTGLDNKRALCQALLSDTGNQPVVIAPQEPAKH